MAIDTTQAIPATSITPTEQYQIPNYTPTPVDPMLVPSLNSQIAGEYDSTNKQLEQLQSEQKALNDSQNSLENTLLGKTADTQTALDTTGYNTELANLSKYNQDLANLNAQAASLNREAQAIPIQLQNESAGRGVTEAGIAPLQSARLRENALKALSIAQQADIASAAATGSSLRLQAAKDKAQQIIDLKYKPLEDQLAFKKAQYERNKDLLASVDKKRTEALNAAIKREDTQIAERKANENGIADLVTNAAVQGAPADIRAKASKAKTPMEAANILGVYAGDYWGTKYKIAQINKLDAEAEETRAKVLAAGGVGSTSQANTKDQAKFLLNTIAEASNLSSASGRSAARRGTEAFLVGATDYTNLESKVRTLKTNLLTLATDPNVKKFFGPQMTEADVRNMQAAATTLDTENQSPAELKAELERAQKIFEKFVPGYVAPVPVKQSAASWAQSIQSALLNPSQGGNYGYQDNTQ